MQGKRGFRAWEHRTRVPSPRTPTAPRGNRGTGRSPGGAKHAAAQRSLQLCGGRAPGPATPPTPARSLTAAAPTCPSACPPCAPASRFLSAQPASRGGRGTRHRRPHPPASSRRRPPHPRRLTGRLSGRLTGRALAAAPCGPAVARRRLRRAAQPLPVLSHRPACRVAVPQPPPPPPLLEPAAFRHPLGSPWGLHRPRPARRPPSAYATSDWSDAGGASEWAGRFRSGQVRARSCASAL